MTWMRESGGRRPALLGRPTTHCGQWSLRFLGLFVIAVVTLLLLVAAGSGVAETLLDNVWLSGAGFVAATAAAAAAAVGVAALREGERAVPVILTVVVTSFVVLFVAAELLVSPR